MKSLRKNPEAATAHAFMNVHEPHASAQAEPLAPARWDWREVRRVLVVRLRSIGDTVLATPTLHALRRFLPDARIDVLLEDWVAPLLDEFEDVSNVITVERKSAKSRARVARALRSTRYDVAYNLHGGTTSTFLTRATGARHRVGYADYRYSRLYNHAAPHSYELWGREKLHSVEQQLALVGWTGVPVSDLPPTHLSVTSQAAASIDKRLRGAGVDEAQPLALIHPAAAFDTKQWATENFARVTEHLKAHGLASIAVSAPHEASVVAALQKNSAASVASFTDLSLPEVTALAARSRLFVGNDSGIAHIAAAVKCPSVVIFGSSNVTHWRPWATAAAAVVREELPCQPCPGYTCAEFDAPECIRRVTVAHVTSAIDEVLERSSQSNLSS
jgi:heptosyltransferase-3